MSATADQRSNRPIWIAFGAGISGLSTYALLAVVAQGLGPGPVDAFSLYWATLIVISIGGYLPLEQIVARHSAADVARHRLRTWAARWGLWTAAAGAGGLLIASVATGTSDISLLLVLLFTVNLGAVAMQAIVRGLAAGGGRLDVYALVAVCDGLGRTVLCAALTVAGVRSLEAYALAIGLGCWASVALGAALLARAPAGTDATPAATSPRLSGEALSLVPAMLSMQLLLNSPIFVAFFVASDGASAGAVLAIASLVRTAVFIAQAAQAAYVARISALVHQRSAQLSRAIAVVTGATVVLVAGTIVGATVCGPWLVSLLYGESFVIGRATCLAVSVGVGLFLLATVANDLSVARGLHRNSGAYWSVALGVAALSAVLLPAGDPRTLGPIMVGSLVALVLTVMRPRAISR